MINEAAIIQKLERGLKNNENINKYIKKLRAACSLDIVLTISGEQMTLLMYYAKNNNHSKVNELLTGDHPAVTTIINNQQYNALAFAVEAANENPNYNYLIIEELLKYNPEQQLLQKKENECIPLHCALEEGNLLLVKLLLTYVAKEQLTVKITRDEDTAFIFAARSKNNALMAWLVSVYPFILDERAADGFTALHVACKFSNERLVWFVLQKGPKDLEIIPDAGGMLPLAQACLNGNEKNIQELLKRNPEKQLTHENNVGITIFHLVSSMGRMDILMLLLKYAEQCGVNLEVMGCKTNSLGVPLIHILATNASSPISINIMHRFLSHGGKKQLKIQEDVLQRTLLFIATENNDIALVTELVKYDCPEQYTLKNKMDKTPLMIAIDNSSISILEILLASGPTEQLSIQFNEMDFLSYAMILKKDIEIIALLLKYSTQEQVATSPKGYALHIAISYQMMDHFKLIMASKFSKFLIKSIEENGGTIPLHTAVDNKNYEATSALLEAGSEVNFVNYKGWSPVHVACKSGDVALLNLLISYGGNIHLTTQAGLTTLDAAIAYDNALIVAELLNNNNLVASISKYLGKVILFAVARGNENIINLLLKSGIDINIAVQSAGSYPSPLFLAIRCSNLRLIELLKNHGANLQQKIIANENMTIYDYIIKKYTSKVEIYEKIRDIFPELPNVNFPIEKQKTVTTPTYHANITNNQQVKPREYLLSIGYPKELIGQFELERKANKAKLKSLYKITNIINDKKPEEIIYFLNGKINSTHPAIEKIESPGGEQNYCYLDLNTLFDQGCSQEQIQNIRLKFDGQHIKKLDNNKGEYFELIKLSPDDEPKERKYTHELKINKLDRIFIIQEGSLFIGIKYVPGGLHNLSEIQALRNSTKSNVCIDIQWPADIVFQRKNKM